MLQKYKYTLTYVCMMACLLLCSCGKKNTDDSIEMSATASETYTISSRSLPVAAGSAPTTGSFLLQGDILYFQDGADANRNLYKQSLKEEAMPTKVLGDLEGSERLQSFTLDEAGNIFCFVRKEEDQYFFRKYNAEGVRLAEQEITLPAGQNKENFYFLDSVADAKGNVYALSEKNIWIFDSTGQEKGRVAITLDNLLDIGVSKEGKPYISYYKDGDTHQSISLIDAESGKVGEQISILGTGQLYTGREKGLLSYDTHYLYEIDPVSGKSIAILDLLKHYVSADGICAVAGDGKEGFTFLTCKDTAIEVITLTHNTSDGGVATEEGKTTIHLVAPLASGEAPDLLKFIMEFNKQSDEYFVTFEALGLSGPDEPGTYANTHLVSDECPDLLMINYYYYQIYAEAGVLEDLSPYLNQSTLLSVDHYLESATAPFRTGDAVYGIPKGFSLRGLVGRKSQVEELCDNMTIDTFLEFLEKNPTAKFEYGGQPPRILELCLKYGMEQYVDFEKGICRFDEEEFRKLLERINDLERSGGNGDWESLKQSNNILFAEIALNDFFTLEKEAMSYGDDMIFLGYPSLDGKMVCEMFPDYNIGIPKNGKNKEGAWEFLKYYLLNYKIPTDMPTEKEKLNSELEAAATPKYKTDENGERVEVPVTQVYLFYNNRVVPVYALSEEKAEHIEKAIHSTKLMTKESRALSEIILEECYGYFYGEKTLDATLDIMQNRCQLYLDENTN